MRAENWTVSGGGQVKGTPIVLLVATTGGSGDFSYVHVYCQQDTAHLKERTLFNEACQAKGAYV